MASFICANYRYIVLSKLQRCVDEYVYLFLKDLEKGVGTRFRRSVHFFSFTCTLCRILRAKFLYKRPFNFHIRSTYTASPILHKRWKNKYYYFYFQLQ